jgi:hypothetical protein
VLPLPRPATLLPPGPGLLRPAGGGELRAALRPARALPPPALPHTGAAAAPSCARCLARVGAGLLSARPGRVPAVPVGVVDRGVACCPPDRSDGRAGSCPLRLGEQPCLPECSGFRSLLEDLGSAGRTRAMGLVRTGGGGQRWTQQGTVSISSP